MAVADVDLWQVFPIDISKSINYTTDQRNATSLDRLWTFTPTVALPDSDTETDAIDSVQAIDDYLLVYNCDLLTLRFAADNSSHLTFTASVYDLNGRRLR